MEKANRALARLAGDALESPLVQDPSPDELPEFGSAPHKTEMTLGAVAHEIRNRLMFVGRFARRLAKTIDPASREGTYLRVIMSETERLEEALHTTQK